MRKLAKQVRDINKGIGDAEETKKKTAQLEFERLNLNYNGNTKRNKEPSKLDKKQSFWSKNVDIKNCWKRHSQTRQSQMSGFLRSYQSYK